jgi:mannose-6-phosphate isomerase
MSASSRDIGVDSTVAIERDAGVRVHGESVLAGSPGPWLMVNAVRNYDWGCHTTLARLQGRLPCGRPEAELWAGAHPVAPSEIVVPEDGAVSLLTAIDRDPLHMLGTDCVERFGVRLPFLLKVLAVKRALSIQVHPSSDQARQGFDREEEDGVPAELRTYVDPFAKPELLVPVSTFVALAGFRPGEKALRMLESLGVPALAPVTHELAGRSGATGCARALIRLATWPRAQRTALAGAILRGVELLLEDRSDGRDGRDPAPPALTEEDRIGLEWVLRLANQHDGDPLIVAPLLLTLHHLAPRQAMYVPAGVPHVYLSGTGIEVMASSDNVVRGGLTTKRVHGDALRDVLDPDAQPVLDPQPAVATARETWWQPPSPEFALSRLVIDGSAVTLRRDPEDLPGPEVFLCLQGEVTVASSRRTISLRPGRAAYVAPCPEAPVLAGAGEVFRVVAGLTTTRRTATG